MNKPAAKEPSMDEILSSIRQIIADDDESAAPRRPSLQIAPDPMEAAPAVHSSLPDDDDVEPLALSSEQIVPEAESAADLGFEALLADAQRQSASVEAAPELVVPDDVSFTPAAEAEVVDLPSFEPLAEEFENPASSEYDDAPQFNPEPEAEVTPLRPAFAAEERFPQVEAAPEPAYSRPFIAAVSPMPDAKLSSDIADGLLETATKAAVRSSIGKLGAAGIGVVASPSLGNGGVTIETMIREMLRPMLKEWLDENLPSVVERMVEKEIARVARGE